MDYYERRSQEFLLRSASRKEPNRRIALVLKSLLVVIVFTAAGFFFYHQTMQITKDRFVTKMKFLKNQAGASEKIRAYLSETRKTIYESKNKPLISLFHLEQARFNFSGLVQEFSAGTMDATYAYFQKVKVDLTHALTFAKGIQDRKESSKILREIESLQQKVTEFEKSKLSKVDFSEGDLE